MGKRCVNNNKGWPCSTACAILADIASNRTVAVTTAPFPSLIDRLLQWTEWRVEITPETKPCGYWLLEYLQGTPWYRPLTLPHFEAPNALSGDSKHTLRMLRWWPYHSSKLKTHNCVFTQIHIVQTSNLMLCIKLSTAMSPPLREEISVTAHTALFSIIYSRNISVPCDMWCHFNLDKCYSNISLLLSIFETIQSNLMF